MNAQSISPDEYVLVTGSFRIDASRSGRPTYGVECQGTVVPVRATALPDLESEFDRLDGSATFQPGDIIVVRYESHPGVGYAEVITDVEYDDEGCLLSVKAKGVHADGLSTKERIVLFKSANENYVERSWRRETWDSRRPGPIQFFVLRPKMDTLESVDLLDDSGAEAENPVEDERLSRARRPTERMHVVEIARPTVGSSHEPSVADAAVLRSKRLEPAPGLDLPKLRTELARLQHDYHRIRRALSRERDRLQGPPNVLERFTTIGKDSRDQHIQRAQDILTTFHCEGMKILEELKRVPEHSEEYNSALAGATDQLRILIKPHTYLIRS